MTHSHFFLNYPKNGIALKIAKIARGTCSESLSTSFTFNKIMFFISRFGMRKTSIGEKVAKKSLLSANILTWHSNIYLAYFYITYHKIIFFYAIWDTLN